MIHKTKMKTEQFPIIAAYFDKKIQKTKEHACAAVMIAVIILICLTSCSEEEVNPQISCEQLKVEIQSAQKAIEIHQAKGNLGNQTKWELDLKTLQQDSTKKANEFKRRAC